MDTKQANQHIQYEGRDENGDKSYFVSYEGRDVGTFQTWDEAYTVLIERVAA